MVLRLRRKLLLDTILLGVALTLLVIVADAFGLLRTFENFFYDQRALRCQQFSSAPTAQLVHLDIDDRALDVIGGWPWKRSKLATIFDELKLANPKVVATDIIFPEAQEIDYTPQPDGSVKPVDHDARFAESIRNLGNVIVPAALFSGQSSASPLAVAMLREFKEKLEMDEGEMIATMRTRGFKDPKLVQALFFPVRREATFARVYELLRESSTATSRPTDVIQTLLHLPPSEIAYASPLTKLIADQFERAKAVIALRRFVATSPPDAPPLVTATGSFYAPLEQFALAATGTGFVDFFSEGVVRTVPLLARHDGRVYPQLGLSLAMKMLDVNAKDIRFGANYIILPVAGREPIRIPVRASLNSARAADLPMLLDIPWMGTRDWETMYDFPGHIQKLQHIPILKVWQTTELQRKVRHNNANCDGAVRVILDEDPPDAKVRYRLALDPAKAKKYFETLPSLNDGASRAGIAAQCIKELDGSGWIQSFKEAEAKTGLNPEEAAQYGQLKDALSALQLTVGQTQELLTQVAEQRAELASDMRGKAVLLGWTATGAAADFVPTPLHAKCPGAVVHGAVFNAIMTANFWRRAPIYVTGIITLLLGFLTAVVAVELSAPKGLACTVAMLISYVLINGLVLFSRFNLIVGVGAPVLAVGIVWAMCTLYRIIVETRERELIKARFQAYVDPTLVNYVLEHPEKARLEGEVKELTVVFTDLANFTTLSEQLGEKSVTLLNEYLAVMVPIIRRHGGYVNKFLGDGIMFFYGAPADSKTHTADAIDTALDMQTAMHSFNEKVVTDGLPILTVRVGISTGTMVVGDAGAADASDYTVLGDAVNLGSRLESSNKVFGTRVMINARGAQCVEGKYLLRPLGSLRVVGKLEGVDVFEPMCPIAEATETQHQTVKLTEAIVAAFRNRQFQPCIEACEVLREHLGGVTKLIKLYRELCEKYLIESPPDDFNGTISLSEK